MLKLLKQNSIKTKDDLKLVIEYYISEKPNKTKQNYLEFIVSIAFAIASFIGIGYKAETNSINKAILSDISTSTIIIILSFFGPIFVVKYIIETIRNPKDKKVSNLISDLTFIYLNYDKYKKRL